MSSNKYHGTEKKLAHPPRGGLLATRAVSTRTRTRGRGRGRQSAHGTAAPVPAQALAYLPASLASTASSNLAYCHYCCCYCCCRHRCCHAAALTGRVSTTRCDLAAGSIGSSCVLMRFPAEKDIFFAHEPIDCQRSARWYSHDHPYLIATPEWAKMIVPVH